MPSFIAIDTLKKEFITSDLSTLWSFISPLYKIDEEYWLTQLLPMATPSTGERHLIRKQGIALINRVRKDKNAVHMIDALLKEYSLDTKEGILLMCLAEALMRIPDAATADALIKDKMDLADWASHLRKSDSLFVNASTWGLLLTGKVVNLGKTVQGNANSIFTRLVTRMSEPVIREAMHQAMKIMGHQFVLGQNVEEAQKNAKRLNDKGFSYSFDMLGESALTSEDAKKYLNDYLLAIKSIGSHNINKNNQGHVATVSIKLSALHPRYEVFNKVRVMNEMFDSMLLLIKAARALNVGLTIDAEEADRLELSLLLFEKLYRHPITQGWGNLGVVVQAYSKRALAVLAWLAGLAKEQGDIIPLRLVKGAYWDSELKISQQNGYSSYPVYTRKEGTDVSYLACARFLLSEHLRGLIYPQFASHNAHTIAAVNAMASHREFEFQRLANSSFVHRLVDVNCSPDELIEHPVDTLLSRSTLANGLIPLPPELFSDRKNSFSINLSIESETQLFEQLLEAVQPKHWCMGPIVDGVHYVEDKQLQGSQLSRCTAPYDRSLTIGTLLLVTPTLIDEAFTSAYDYFPIWNQQATQVRANYLYKLADLLEENCYELIALCQHEAGKTIHDCLDEVREAVDFCRYYAQQAVSHSAGEKNQTQLSPFSESISREGKGVFVCISPWNFPLAIFIGQIAAALVTGNTVIAKPAEQTSLIASRTVLLMLEAGFPKQVIHLMTGTGREIGEQLTQDKRVAGVVFTGSTMTAQVINRSLAKRNTIPATFIAETGGQNAMIVDSTALPEQVVRDVIRSAFASAGQRCSALRVLFIQEDIAERVITLIKGAMQELVVGLPYLYQTDIGPVIDKRAKNKLNAYIDDMLKKHSLVASVKLNESCLKGDFITPIAIEINHLEQLKEEQFGPILHIIRYASSELEGVIEQINNTNFGLTMGIHSRNETAYKRIAQASRVGNCYINRDQVGAVVGVQPFGGQGLSGTGPKAGGPRYLYRFTQPVLKSSNTIK